MTETTGDAGAPDIAALVARLSARGLTLWAEGDAIRFRGAQHPDNAADLAQVKARKPEVLAWLARAGGRTPLTVSQRMWFRPRTPNERLSAEYRRTPHIWQVFGRFDVDAMNQALERLVARHDQLRTRYLTDGAQDWQEVADNAAVAIEVFRLPVTAKDGAQEVYRQVKSCYLMALDYSDPRRLNALFFDGGLKGSFFALVVDHIVLDDRSMGIIIRELFALYREAQEGKPADLAPLTRRYADHVAETAALHAPARLARNSEFWRERLDGTEPVCLHAGSMDPAPPSQREVVRFSAPAPASAALHDLARARGASISVAALALFGRLLGEWTQTDRVLFGWVVDGRHGRDADVVGSFVRTAPVYLDLSGDPGFPKLIDRAREAHRLAADPEHMIEIGDLPGLHQVTLNLRVLTDAMMRMPGPAQLAERQRQEARRRGSFSALRPAPSMPAPAPGGEPGSGTEGAAPLTRFTRWRPPVSLIDATGLDLQVFLAAGAPNVFAGHAFYAADRLELARVNAFRDGFTRSLATLAAIAPA